MKKILLFSALFFIVFLAVYFQITREIPHEKSDEVALRVASTSLALSEEKMESNKANDFVCGESLVKDEDGNEYNTVIVGTQCWMAKNMNVGKMLQGSNFQANNGIVEKYCYDNDLENCFSDGGIYAFMEAVKGDFLTEGVRGICPLGWHIPKDSEWYVLENFLKDQNQTCNPSRVRFMTGPKRHISEWDCSGASTKMVQGGSSGLNIPLAGGALGNNDNILDARVPSTEMVFGGRSLGAALWSSSPSSRTRMLLVDDEVGRMVGRGDDNASGTGSVRCLKDPL